MAVSSDSSKRQDDISLKDVIRKITEWIHFLISKWKWLLAFAIVGALVGLLDTVLKDTEYTASISFVTDSKSSQNSGLSLYAGLAAQYGLTGGNFGFNDELFSGGNIFDLMQTRLMLQQTLMTSVDFDNKPTLLINRYIEIEKLKEKYKSFRNIAFKNDSSALSPAQNGAIKFVCSAIAKKMEDNSSAGSIMTISFTSKDEEFSRAFLMTLISNVEQFYVATKTKKARENLNVLQSQLDSVKNRLYGAMGNVANFQDFNQNLVKQAPRVQQQKNSMQVTINSAIYQQLVTGLQTAKMTLQQETPLFEIIDEPVLPLDNNKGGKLKWAIVGGLLGLFLSGGWLLFRHIYQEIMGSEF